MQKITQDTDSLLQKLSVLETGWKDAFADKVINFLETFGDKDFTKDDTIKELLKEDFEVSTTIFRLFLEKSKDEFNSLMKELVPDRGMAGKRGFEKNPELYVKTLSHFLLRQKIIATIDRDYTWEDIIVERLKAGRGSAIKGQKRGRNLEDFVENIVSQVFDSYDPRCSFVGMKGTSTEKADFAIPSKNHPEILIEVKGYGATGSKQTDVIGDVNRIIQEKRHDTIFLLFTDGITWKDRESDFKKLVDFQNHGYIYKIYTKQMEKEFLEDLRLIKVEKRL